MNIILEMDVYLRDHAMKEIVCLNSYSFLERTVNISFHVFMKSLWRISSIYLKHILEMDLLELSWIGSRYKIELSPMLLKA
jgi:hypothetical protein